MAPANLSGQSEGPPAQARLGAENARQFETKQLGGKFPGRPPQGDGQLIERSTVPHGLEQGPLAGAETASHLIPGHEGIRGEGTGTQLLGQVGSRKQGGGPQGQEAIAPGGRCLARIGGDRPERQFFLPGPLS